MPNYRVFRATMLGIVSTVLGRYLIVGYLDPLGKPHELWSKPYMKPSNHSIRVPYNFLYKLLITGFGLSSHGALRCGQALLCGYSYISSSSEIQNHEVGTLAKI